MKIALCLTLSSMFIVSTKLILVASNQKRIRSKQEKYFTENLLSNTHLESSLAEYGYEEDKPFVYHEPCRPLKVLKKDLVKFGILVPVIFGYFGSGCDNQHLHHFHSSYAVYLNFDLDNDNYHRLCYHILWKAQEMGRRWSFERLFFCIEHILSCIKLNYLFNLQILHSAVKPGQKTKMRRHGPILSSRPGSTGPLRRPN